MPVCSLPEVETPIVPKERVVTSRADLKNDYGTPVMTFLYHAPSAAGNSTSPLESVDSWIAWELAIAEEQVHKQIDKGTLPTDDSIQSRMTRSGYRGKVIAALRENGESLWLLRDSNPSPKMFDEVVKKDMVNAKIREILRKFYLKSGHLRNALVINIVANVIALTGDGSPRTVLSDVQFSRDIAAQDADPDIRQCNFTVVQEELEASDDAHLSIEWMDSMFKLDMEAWREISKDDGGDTQERIKAGRKILQEMRLVVNDKL